MLAIFFQFLRVSIVFKETLKKQIYTIITASKESGLTNVEVMETVKAFCRANQSEP